MRATILKLLLIAVTAATGCAAPIESKSTLNESVCGNHNGVTTLCSQPTDNYVKYRWDANVWKDAHDFGELAMIMGPCPFRPSDEREGPFSESDHELECSPVRAYTGWKQNGGDFTGKCMVYGPRLDFLAPPPGKVHAFTAYIRTTYAKWSSDAYVDIEITASGGTKVLSRERWHKASWPGGGIKSQFATADGVLKDIEVRICNNKSAYLTLENITLKHEYIEKGGQP